MKKKSPRRVSKRIAFATALAGIAGLTLIRPSVPGGILPPDYVSAVEVYDGYFHNVLIDTPYIHYATPYQEENAAPQSDGWYAVWQHLTDKGWQIVLFNAQGNKLTSLTDAAGDHTDAHIDGHYVVWQGNDEGIGNIYLYDIDHPENGAVKISTNAPAKHPRISNGVVVWQQWQGKNWEIYIWQQGQTSQFTNGNLPSIEPDIFHSMVVWNEVYPGPLNRIRTYNISTGEDSYLDTESKGQIRPKFLPDGTFQWYAFTDEGYVKQEYNFLTENEYQELIKAAEPVEAPPVPEPSSTEDTTTSETTPPAPEQASTTDASVPAPAPAPAPAPETPPPAEATSPSDQSASTTP